MMVRQEGALREYRILDLTDSRGAYCAKLLADLGADVIKIEPPVGDPMRNFPPFVNHEPDPNKSLYFLFRNSNKRGVTLDLDSDEGKAALLSLVRTADVLVENFSPDHMAELDLDYPRLMERNPRLIIASMTEFGRSGPYKDYRGSNIVNCALSGIMISSGFSERPCTLPGTPAYDGASLMVAIAILAALYSRGRTGQGQHIDTSVHETARLALYPWPVTLYSYSLNPDSEPPGPEPRMSASLYPCFPCKDGLIRVVAMTPRQWKALVRVLGSPEELLKPELEDFIHRILNPDTITALVKEFTEKATMAELVEAGHAEGVPIVPIFSIPGFIDSDQAKARRFFVEVEHPVTGKIPCPGPPYRWTETPPRIKCLGPRLGEHNDEVLSGLAQASPRALEPVAGGEEGDKIGRAPLEGVRVISLGTGAVIPDFGMILGQLGADVIKIESSDNLDFMRTLSGDKNNVAGFNEANRNKRSFGVNLKTEKGKEIVRRLIQMSDIVGENFRGGVVRGLGVDYETVRPLKPDIVYIGSQGFGRGGPYSDYLAYGPMLAAASGLLSMWGHPDDPYPTGSNAPIPDHIASKQAVVAALAALDYRRRTGKGQFIDMAQTEVAANLIGEHYLDYLINRRLPEPRGNRSPTAAPHGAYPCKGQDNWCAISVSTDEEWRKLCKILDRPDWISDPRFATLSERLQNHDELDQGIAEWTSDREAQEVMDGLQGEGVPAGVVQRAQDTIVDPQLKCLGAIIEQDHPVGGRRLYPNVPFKLPASPPRPSIRAPLLGEHTDEICHELLGMSDKEIMELKEEGVLEDAGL